MSLYQWLLFFHVTGAFFLIGGIVIAGILNIAAIAKDRRPSEIAALYGLIRFAVPLIGAGLLLTLAIGLWLVNEVGYGYGETWIVTAIALWVLASALGNIVHEALADRVLVVLHLHADRALKGSLWTGRGPSP